MKDKKVCVVGLGYIGLPTALMFSDCDMDVVGLDVDDLLVMSIGSTGLDDFGYSTSVTYSWQL